MLRSGSQMVSRQPVALLPAAGGASLGLRTLAAALEAHGFDAVIHPYPGDPMCRDRTRSLHDFDVDAFAAQLAQELACASGQQPILIGHSFGALMAAKTSMRLTETGTPPALTVLCAPPAPGPQPLALAVVGGNDALMTALIGFGADLSILRAMPELQDVYLPLLHRDLNHVQALVPESHGWTLAAPVLLLLGAQDEIAPAEVSVAHWTERAANCRTVWLEAGHFLVDGHSERIRSEIVGALSWAESFK